VSGSHSIRHAYALTRLQVAARERLRFHCFIWHSLHFDIHSSARVQVAAGRRRTVLLSATLHRKLGALAELAMSDPAVLGFNRKVSAALAATHEHKGLEQTCMRPPVVCFWV
jgi:hypothetical protein